MSDFRDTVALFAPDISAFCKNLRSQLVDGGANPPGHVALLNMLARSAGYRNYQMLKARPGAPPPVAQSPQPVALALPRDLKVTPEMRKLVACFDTEGRLMRWPNKYAAQQIAIHALWSRLPLRRELSEADVNRYLDAAHTYGDPATLRRELVNAKLLWRTIDGRVYRKLAARPEAQTREFLDLLFGHTATGAAKHP
jgi:hypothetical protein